LIPLIIVIICCAVTAGIVISIVFFRSAHTSDEVRDRIMQDLENNGYQLIDIRIPGSFSKRPFSDKRAGINVRSPLKGSEQERTKYRIVRYKDSNGVIRKSWVRIHSTSLEMEEITWLPEI
jgi:hypothetical protein